MRIQTISPIWNGSHSHGLFFGNALARLTTTQNQPLDDAIEQYRSEVTTLTKLTKPAPRNGAWQLSLRASQESLNRVLKMLSSQSRQDRWCTDALAGFVIGPRAAAPSRP